MALKSTAEHQYYTQLSTETSNYHWQYCTLIWSEPSSSERMYFFLPHHQDEDCKIRHTLPCCTICTQSSSKTSRKGPGISNGISRHSWTQFTKGTKMTTIERGTKETNYMFEHWTTEVSYWYRTHHPQTSYRSKRSKQVLLGKMTEKMSG